MTLLLLILALVPAHGSNCPETCKVIEACSKKIGRPGLSRVLCHIAACESGDLCGKKEIRSPNGLYHGPFQLAQGTWDSICQPFFKKKGIKTCSEENSIYDSCCTTMCSAELIGKHVNRGIKNWPHCGPAAEREIASENASRSKPTAD